MKNELYEYACPQKRMTAERFEAEKKKQNTQTNDRIGYISIFCGLGVFSLPMALDNTLLWVTILAVYLTILIVNMIKDKDPYPRFLLSYGATLVYLGIIISYLIIDGAYDRFGYSCWGSLIGMTVILVVCYECSVLLNMLLKQYTARAHSKKSHPAMHTAIGTAVGCMIGSFLAKVISPQITTSLWSVWLVVLGCGVLYMLAFSFLQKYLLYKILKKHQNC